MIQSSGVKVMNQQDKFKAFSSTSDKSGPSDSAFRCIFPRPRTQIFQPERLPVIVSHKRNGENLRRKRGRPRKYLANRSIDDFEDSWNNNRFQESNSRDEQAKVFHFQDSKNYHFKEFQDNHFQGYRNVGNFQESRPVIGKDSSDHYMKDSRTSTIEEPKRYNTEEYKNERLQYSKKRNSLDSCSDLQVVCQDHFQKFITNSHHKSTEDQVNESRNSHFQESKNSIQKKSRIDEVEESPSGHFQESINDHFRSASRNMNGQKSRIDKSHFQIAWNNHIQHSINDRPQNSRVDDAKELRNADRHESIHGRFRKSPNEHIKESRPKDYFQDTVSLQESKDDNFQESRKTSYLQGDKKSSLLENYGSSFHPKSVHHPLCNDYLITKQMIAERKRAYSEIVDLSPQKSWPMEPMHDEVNGCFECYYGNTTCYSYPKHLLKNAPGTCHCDLTSTNQNTAFRMPFNTVNVPAHWFIDDKCGYHLAPDVRPRSSVAKGESVPIIIECFSLSKGKDDFKTNVHDKDSQFSLASRLYPDKKSPEIDVVNVSNDKCKLCQPDKTRTQLDQNNQHTDHRVQLTPRCSPTQMSASERKLSSSDDHSNSSPKSSPKQPRYTSSNPTKEEPKENRNSIDVYEVYHSKYYKTTRKVQGCDEENEPLKDEEERIIEVEVPEKRNMRVSSKTAIMDKLLTDNHVEDTIEEEDYFKLQKEKVKSKNILQDGVFFQDLAPKSNQNTSEVNKTNVVNCQESTGEPKGHIDPINENHEKNWTHHKEEVIQDQSNTRSYICVHCGREFTHLSSLNNHVRTHTGQKPFKCQFCGKRFAQSGVLTAHLRTHTGDRPFECIICKKRFAQTTTLANHIRTHTGQKPFNCKFCKRKFAQSSTRNKHELSHTKEKPYVCKYCGRCFAQSATVTRHMRIHLRQEAFVCVYCGKEFPYLHVLDKHLDSHNRTET